MDEPLIVIDSSEIHVGKLDEVKTALKELVDFVEANEPRPISYGVFFDPAGTQMTVVQIHPDSASMEFHMGIAGPEFGRFADLLSLSRMDVYGKPSAALLERLRSKVQMLGTASIQVHEFHAGFARFGAR